MFIPCELSCYINANSRLAYIYLRREEDMLNEKNISA